MPSPEASSDARLKSFTQVLQDFNQSGTHRDSRKLRSSLVRLLKSFEAGNLYSHYHDHPQFWAWLSTASDVAELVLNKLTCDQFIEIVIAKRLIPAAFKNENAKYPKLQLFMFLIGKDDRISHESQLDELILGMKETRFLSPVAKDLLIDNLMTLIRHIVRLIDGLWHSVVDARWWEHSKLRDLVMVLDELHISRPEIPLNIFYSNNQENLFKIHDTLVLLRGNQEPRQMGRLIHKLFDLESKAKLIELENNIQMRHELQDAFFRTLFEGIQSTSLNLVVRREHLVRDTLAQIESKKPYELRRQLRVKFQGEDGVDEGGLKKEFFQLFLRACFNPEYGLFTYHEESRYIWFRPMADDRMTHEAAEDCYSIGKLFGLAIYNSVLLDVSFPMSFYKMLAEKPIGIDDLIELEPSLGKGLKAILDMDEEAFDASGLDGIPFEIEVNSGSEKALHFHLPTTHQNLTYGNRTKFVQLYAEAILHRTVELPLQAFIRGFKFTFGKSIIFQFHPTEIEALLCGSQVFDYSALQASTIYEGGFSARSPVIRWFWEIFHKELEESQRRKFLAFVTGTDRAPVGGLGQLELRIVKNGPDAARLPTSHTCFNTLLLNNYSKKERLRFWLLTAIENCSGFGLQ